MRVFTEAGHEAIHPEGLPGRNETPDSSIITIADREDRVVVTKDRHFVDSHLLRGAPRKLLLITTGNIPNDALGVLLVRNLPAIAAAFAHHQFIELSRTSLSIRS